MVRRESSIPKNPVESAEGGDGGLGSLPVERAVDTEPTLPSAGADDDDPSMLTDEQSALTDPPTHPDESHTDEVPLPRFDHTHPRPSLSLGEQEGSSLPQLMGVMRRLLDEDGCPWDREQTLATLKPFVLEEACEVMDAIDAENPSHLREELGDLLLQIAFQSELSRRAATFGIDDVVEGIVSKLVQRHPHVFGDTSVSGTAEVLKNWEALKQAEKGKRPLLASIPRNLPALLRAQKMGRKVAKVGFDWASPDGSKEKVHEELRELEEAVKEGVRPRIEEEFGDLLFALVNYARHIDIDAEAALRSASDKFSRRFSHVEARVQEKHGGFPETPLALSELDAYWDEAKAQERTP